MAMGGLNVGSTNSIWKVKSFNENYFKKKKKEGKSMRILSHYQLVMDTSDTQLQNATWS